MLIDSSVGYLNELHKDGKPFLIQCPKTRVLHKMNVKSHRDNLYYLVKRIPLRNIDYFFVRKEFYVNNYNGSAFVICGLKELVSNIVFRSTARWER